MPAGRNYYIIISSKTRFLPIGIQFSSEVTAVSRGTPYGRGGDARRVIVESGWREGKLQILVSLRVFKTDRYCFYPARNFLRLHAKKEKKTVKLCWWFCSIRDENFFYNFFIITSRRIDCNTNVDFKSETL